MTRPFHPSLSSKLFASIGSRTSSLRQSSPLAGDDHGAKTSLPLAVQLTLSLEYTAALADQPTNMADTSSPLTTSPPPSPGVNTHVPTHTAGPNPAPISSSLHNPSDGLPRRRPTRKVTLDQDAERRGTTDSARSRRSGRAGSRQGSAVDPNAGVLRRMTSGLFTPEKKIGKAPTYLGSAKAAIMSTWL